MSSYELNSNKIIKPHKENSTLYTESKQNNDVSKLIKASSFKEKVIKRYEKSIHKGRNTISLW